MLNLPMAQSRTGAEYRAASAIDIALWDLFGKVCNQPVHQMLGGLCRDRSSASTTPAPATAMSAPHNIKPVSNWNFSARGRSLRGPERLHDTAPTPWRKACWSPASPR